MNYPPTIQIHEYDDHIVSCVYYGGEKYVLHIEKDMKDLDVEYYLPMITSELFDFIAEEN